MDRSYGLSDKGTHPCHKFSETKNYCWSKDSNTTKGTYSTTRTTCSEIIKGSFFLFLWKGEWAE